MQTIGERLEEARKKKGISIREAAEATKIRGDYLQKFESNQFDIGLTEIYTRGFLRSYSNYLKLPAERILNDYAALGRGEIRPRQPSREIYGRMDITVASSGEASDRAAPPAEGASAAEAPPAPAHSHSQSQPRYPRGNSAQMPGGLDPALVFKYVKWGGIAVALIVLLLIIKAAFSGGSSGTASNTPRTTTPATTAPAPAANRSYRLIAKDTVRIWVRKQINENIEGDEIVSTRTLSPGEVVVVPWSEPQFIWYSSGEALTMERSDGQRFPMPVNGTARVAIQAPR